jgi:hypothetical protein
MIAIFFPPLSFVTVFGSRIRDPRPEIRDPGWVKIRIRDPGWVKIRIRDKYPGSATLSTTLDKKLYTTLKSYGTRYLWERKD